MKIKTEYVPDGLTVPPSNRKYHPSDVKLWKKADGSYFGNLFDEPTEFFDEEESDFNKTDSNEEENEEEEEITEIEESSGSEAEQVGKHFFLKETNKDLSISLTKETSKSPTKHDSSTKETGKSTAKRDSSTKETSKSTAKRDYSTKETSKSTTKRGRSEQGAEPEFLVSEGEKNRPAKRIRSVESGEESNGNKRRSLYYQFNFEVSNSLEYGRGLRKKN